MRVKELKIINEKICRTLILLAALSVFFTAQKISAQNEDDEEQRPLNLSVVEKALRSTKTSAANKNSLLIEGVNRRKITFWLTAENEKKLRAWGANNALLEAVRKNQMPMYSMIQKDMKLGKPVEVKNSIGIEFVLIPAGEFTMGLAPGEKSAAYKIAEHDGTPPHSVKIKQDFYLGKYEVTQGQWLAVMGKNPSEAKDCGGECPVENMTWKDVQVFIRKLNEKNDGYRYRLPSEAEWEYAARSTTTTKYYWGEDADKKNRVYYAHNAQNSPAKVGSYLPNAFGLYDMSGNVWEMTEDVYRIDFTKVDDDSAPQTDYYGNPEFRTVKGGGWGQNLSLDELRISSRDSNYTESPDYSKGFRLAATPVNLADEPKTVTDEKLNAQVVTPLEIVSAIKGEVKVAVFVDENGKVLTAKAISGHPLLTEKAVALAKDAKFKEMKVDGKPARVRGTLTFTFK